MNHSIAFDLLIYERNVSVGSWKLNSVRLREIGQKNNLNGNYVIYETIENDRNIRFINESSLKRIDTYSSVFSHNNIV